MSPQLEASRNGGAFDCETFAEDGVSSSDNNIMSCV